MCLIVLICCILEDSSIFLERDLLLDEFRVQLLIDTPPHGPGGTSVPSGSILMFSFRTEGHEKSSCLAGLVTYPRCPSFFRGNSFEY